MCNAAGFKDGGRCDMRVLIIEEDPVAAAELVTGIKAAGFNVDYTASLQKGSYQARTSDYDVIVYSYGTSHGSALELCRTMRNRSVTSPLMILSSDTTLRARCTLIEAGADDYLIKPFVVTEVLARLRALGRRPRTFLGDVLSIDDLVVDTARFYVTRDGRPVRLTRKEFGVLEYLLRHQGVVISRTALIEHVWDIHADLFSNSLETHILNLRKKLEQKQKPKLIHTICGRGYKIAIEP
jgi:DNA-binding response OmpR family regulator